MDDARATVRCRAHAGARSRYALEARTLSPPVRVLELAVSATSCLEPVLV